MNDISELEAELKRLRPVAPSDDLHRRIGNALTGNMHTAAVISRRPNESRKWFYFGAAALGLASVVTLCLVALDRTPMPTKTASAAGFQPAGLTQEIYAGRDEGLVFSPNDSNPPRRQLRFQTRETLRWRDAQTGASLRVSYPVEQVVLTPVALQ